MLTLKHKIIYFITAAAFALMLLGTPLSVSTAFAGECVPASGQSC